MFTIFRKLIVLALVFIAGFLMGRDALPGAPITDNSPEIVASKENTRLMIDYGNGTIEIFDIASLTATSTLASVMVGLDAEGKIDLASKDYGGEMGLFIEKINGVPSKPSSDSWWQFWVNNVYSNTGASSYAVKPGDIIEFKFTKGQE